MLGQPFPYQLGVHFDDDGGNGYIPRDYCQLREASKYPAMLCPNPNRQCPIHPESFFLASDCTFCPSTSCHHCRPVRVNESLAPRNHSHGPRGRGDEEKE